MSDLGDDREPVAAVGDLAEVRSRVLALYQEHGEELRRFILGVTRDLDLTGDVMQATLAKALELGHSARPESLKGWLFRVAFHEALATRRREQARSKAFGKLARDAIARPEPPDAPLIRGESIKAVRQALRELPEAQRKVVVARLYGDKPFAQIAREAGLPLGTVLTRMRLALEKLRKALASDSEIDAS